MEILIDMMKIIKKIDADNQVIMKNTDNFGHVKKFEIDPEKAKEPSIDYDKLTKMLTPNLAPYIEKVVSCTNHIIQFSDTIPKEVELKKVWGIEKNTKIFLFIISLLISMGYFFAPKMNNEYIKYQLEKREKQIQNYRNNNPKVYKKYFE